MTDHKGGHPKGSKLSEIYGPTQFSLKIRAFKTPFVIHYARRNPDSGRMEYAFETMATPQDLIDFQVKLTAGHVQMIEGLSLTVQLFGVLAEQCDLLEETGRTTEFRLPEGGLAPDAPKACIRRLWTGAETGKTTGKTVCQHPNRTMEMDCHRQNCPDKEIQEDDRYWRSLDAG